MVKEFNFINVFRALAAFWVLLDHCMIWGNWRLPHMPMSKIAVDLFMMISGYLMAANTFSRRNFEPLTTGRNWLRFWLRRFFRLAPAYYVSLALAIVTSSYFLGGYRDLQNLNPSGWPDGGTYDPSTIEYTFSNVMLHLSFLFGLHPQYSFSTMLPDWSLSLEMQFYFVFPALILAMQRFGFLRISMCLGLPIFFVGLFISKHAHFDEPSLLFMKLNFFIAGILLFQVLSTTDWSKRKRLVLMLGAFVLASIDFFGKKNGNEIVLPPFLLLAMFVLGWWESANKTPRLLSFLLNSRLVHFASDTSYGVYLFHGFFLSACGLILFNFPYLLDLPPYQRVLGMIVFVTTSAYLTAYAVYRYIELPGIAFGKRVIQKIALVQK